MAEAINFIVKDKSFEKFAMMSILGIKGDAMDIKMRLDFFCIFFRNFTAIYNPEIPRNLLNALILW